GRRVCRLTPATRPPTPPRPRYPIRPVRPSTETAVEPRGARPWKPSMSELHTLLTGLAFGESPRWRDGRLWLSDMGANEVVAVDLEGRSELIARVPGMPMGLGWLPDGRLLIVSARDGRLLR